MRLTVVAIPAEEHVEADEVWSVAEVRALGDENLLDVREAADDYARRCAEGYAENFAVHLAQVGEGYERRLALPQEVKTADNGPRLRARRSLPF